MTQKLAKLNYRDTNFLSNAAIEEKSNITALSMHYKIGRYEPSNPFIVQYRNKDNLVDLYKQVTQKN